MQRLMLHVVITRNKNAPKYHRLIKIKQRTWINIDEINKGNKWQKKVIN